MFEIPAERILYQISYIFSLELKMFCKTETIVLLPSDNGRQRGTVGAYAQ